MKRLPVRPSARLRLRTRAATSASAQTTLFFPQPPVFVLTDREIDETRPKYRITVGEHTYYALDEAEREGILARIEAEGIEGEVDVVEYRYDDSFLASENLNRVIAGSGIVVESELQTLDPPHSAEFLLYLILSAKDREIIPGDLHEEFAEIMMPRFGRRRARWWYWTQVFRSIIPIVLRRVLQIFKIAVVARLATNVVKWFGS